MKKKLSLDETWRLCLSMWRWIAKEIRNGSELDVEDLKEEWMKKKHLVEDKIQMDCFFCEYDDRHRKDDCSFCPAYLVDEKFDCTTKEYSYYHKPIAFYNKLRSLNRKRLAKK